MSIKCKHCANPAILNHTPRSANAFQNPDLLNNHLLILDSFIKNINHLREKNIFGEDIPIKKIDNIDKETKKILIEVLKYFVFEGSGSKLSQNPSNSILEIIDPYDYEKYIFIQCIDDIQKEKYIDSIYNKIIISMRDKGMQKNISELSKPWVFEHNKNGLIKYKDRLHIRIKN